MRRFRSTEVVRVSNSSASHHLNGSAAYFKLQISSLVSPLRQDRDSIHRKPRDDCPSSGQAHQDYYGMEFLFLSFIGLLCNFDIFDTTYADFSSINQFLMDFIS